MDNGLVPEVNIFLLELMALTQREQSLTNALIYDLRLTRKRLKSSQGLKAYFQMRF